MYSSFKVIMAPMHHYIRAFKRGIARSLPIMVFEWIKAKFETVLFFLQKHILLKTFNFDLWNGLNTTSNQSPANVGNLEFWSLEHGCTKPSIQDFKKNIF